MADPVLPGVIRAQTILSGRSGLPEDVFVNTWTFRTPSGGVDALHFGQVMELLTDFWTKQYGASNVMGLLGPQVDWTKPMRVKMYDLEVPANQRQPVENQIVMAGAAPAINSPLPGEVAICLSYYAEINRPRRRGRVYIGPLRLGITTSTIETFGELRPAPATLTTLAGAASAMADTDSNVETSWVMLSQADGSTHKITNGWIDNAFDTQRRRGIEASSRLSWQPPQPTG